MSHEMKAVADVEAVKAAYEHLQEKEVGSGDRRPRRIVGVIDLAEEIAGRSFWGQGVSRQSVARKVVDWPQLERTVEALVAYGWLRQVSAAEARAMGVGGVYGVTPNGRYYMTETDWQAAFARQERRNRNLRRRKLLAAAQAEVLAVYDGEVQRRYQVACAAEGLTPTEPETGLDT